MPLDPDRPLDAVLIGRLQRDYLLPFDRPARVDSLGGALPYAAAGMAMWGGRAGLVARVNAGYPLEWLERLQDLGCDLRGVKKVEEAIDSRRFIAYSDPLTPHSENPLTFFAERQLPFPRELLGYDASRERYCSKTDCQPYSLRVNDVPRAFLELSAAHICPVDFISHKILPSVLKGGLIQSLTMRASPCYMDPAYWEEMRALLSDLTGFMLSEAEALRLYQGRSVDLWEIMEGLAAYGPEFIILSRGDGAVQVLDRVRKLRALIPAYANRTVDPTGAWDVFDGACLLHYRLNYDPIEGALGGQIAASFAIEGSGPYYALDALEGLKEARLDMLRQRLRLV